MKNFEDLTVNDFSIDKLICDCKKPDIEHVGYRGFNPTLITVNEKPTIRMVDVYCCRKCGLPPDRMYITKSMPDSLEPGI